MRLYPAIDIKDGQCVRLKKGLFNEVTVYSYKPYGLYIQLTLTVLLKDMALMQKLSKR